MQKRDPYRPGAVLTPEEIAALTKVAEEDLSSPEEPFGWDTAPADPDAVRLEPGGGLDVIAGGPGDSRLVGSGKAQTVAGGAPAPEPPQPTAAAAGVDVISLRAGGETWVAADAAPRHGNSDSPYVSLTPLLARLHRIQARHALLRTPRRRRRETLS